MRNADPASRRRLRRAAIVAVAAAVAIITSAVFLLPRPGATPTAPYPNVRIDQYPANGSKTPQGVEPRVAVAPNGTIGITWIRFDPIIPTLYLNQDTNFTTQIWYAFSSNTGATFSPPELVSGDRTECVDPSIVFAPDGTLLIAYLSTPSANHSVLLAYERPGQPTFASEVVAAGTLLDRPWVAVVPNGTVYVAYTNQAFVPQLTLAPEATLAFSPPIAFINTQAEITGVAVSASRGLVIGLQNSGEEVSSAVWSPGGTAPVVPTGYRVWLTGTSGPPRRSFPSRVRRSLRWVAPS